MKKLIILAVGWVVLAACSTIEPPLQPSPTSIKTATPTPTAVVELHQVEELIEEKPVLDQGLFHSVDYLGENALISAPTISNHRYIRVDFDLLGGTSGPVIGDQIEIQLFDEIVKVAQVTRIEKNAQGGITLFGKFMGVEHSQIIFVVNETTIVGKITQGPETYEIKPVVDDIHVLLEIDQSAFDED
jgi:hypothetical protein